MPKVTIDFFRVHFVDPDQKPDFATVLQAIDSRQGRDRNVMTTGGWNHFHRLSIGQRRLAGDVLRVRSDQLPVAVDLDGAVEDLALATDQGIAPVTYFYFRKINDVILLLRSPGGLSGPGFEHLVKELSGVDVELRPVPQPEVIKKLRRMRTINQLQFKFSTPDAARHFRAGGSIAGLFDVMSEFDANVAELRLAVVRRKESKLNRAKAVALAEQLHRIANKTGEVQKAKVRGLDPIEERTIGLDLLRGRMVVSAEVAVGANRRLDDDSCMGALEKAYMEKREDLKELYDEA